MNKLLLFLFSVLYTVSSVAQMLNPVRMSSLLDVNKNGTEADIVFQATIDSGWHVYSTDLGDNGPIQASFHVIKMDGVETVGKLKSLGNELRQYDKMFGMELRFFEKNAKFVQHVRFTKPTYVIDCYLEYGACNDLSCLPPSTCELKKEGTVALAVEKKADLVPLPEKQPTVDVKSEEPSADIKSVESSVAVVDDSMDLDLWQPVVKELSEEAGNDVAAGDLSLWLVFFEGLLGGFLALFTPCVWPVIPMTVSFFLKRNKDRKKAVSEAMTYGLSIVVIYVLLGLTITLLFGSSALNALATNAVFNIFLCLLLVLFAASFFGAFEIVLPASWANKVDQKSASTTGLLSIFLMAFTLALVSFSCTGPIIGFLLVAVSVQGSILAPAIGMFGFAVALAIPFTLFALFPSWLKSAPKSGRWMNVVKVTLGFIELAFALKFLSVADLAYGWHILDREVFLSLWIVIFGLLGAYLLGWIRFPNDDDDRRTNVPQFFLAMFSLAFAVYMIPGLWGAPLKAVSAFTPPMSTQDFRLQQTTVEPRYRDYEAGMAAAKAEGKPVMIDFTGFGCVNCRKMEAAVWSDAQVVDLLNEKYVLISLYVDDKTPLVQPIEVTESGQQRILRTVGDKWSYLQRVKFGANAQPFYVLLDADGLPLCGSRSYDEDVSAYVDFLNVGLQRFKDSFH